VFQTVSRAALSRDAGDTGRPARRILCPVLGLAVHTSAMRSTVLVTLALAGCDSFAGSDYIGEPLIVLAGSFAPSSTPSEHVGGIALLWQDAEGAGGPGKASMAVPVSIEFPAAFHVAVPAPPPEEVRFGFADGPALAECYVYVVADAASPHPTRFLGSDRTHALIYAEASVEPGTAAADYLGGPVGPGFHLRRYVATDTPSHAQAELIDRCVAGGDPPAACAARRHYQLAATSDAEPLRIVLNGS
jgi:hypothetical protein